MRKLQFENAFAYLKKTLPELQGIYLFGSEARGESRSESDVDIAILCQKPLEKSRLFEIAQVLAGMLQKEVDLIDLLSATTVFRFQIISTAKRVYCKSNYECAYFEMLAYSMYYRFQEERKQLLNFIYQKGKIIDD